MGVRWGLSAICGGLSTDFAEGRAHVDHGTVALVLVLKRLTMPLPLYQVADWLAQTVLAYTLGIPATKFNDDRLARTLDAI